MIIRIFAASVSTKPLNDAQMRGAFLFIYVHSQNTLMERLPHFTKHYMTETDLLADKFCSLCQPKDFSRDKEHH